MLEKAVIQQPELWRALKAKTEELGFDMASDYLTGALLQVLAASKPGGRMLELGTSAGLGTLWLLSGMDEAATLVSVETDERVHSMAREVLGHDQRLSLVLEDGATFIRRQAEHSFDLVFADAIPGKFELTFEALQLVKPGGFYVIDDLLPQPNWPEGHGKRVDELMYRLCAHPAFLTVPIAWSTGVEVLVRRPPLAHQDR